MTAIPISPLKHAIKFPTEKFALALGLAPQPVHGLAGTMAARPPRRFVRQNRNCFVIAATNFGFGWRRTASPLP